MNYMPIKFQPSILINKKNVKLGGGGLWHNSASCKDYFGAQSVVNQHICISLYSVYTYQISAFYLDKQKSGAFGPTQEPLRGPEERYPMYLHIIVFLFL